MRPGIHTATAVPQGTIAPAGGLCSVTGSLALDESPLEERFEVAGQRAEYSPERREPNRTRSASLPASIQTSNS
jgi:hypothetical protein